MYQEWFEKLAKELEIEKVIYNTYQSVSGSGKQGIDDLLRCRKGTRYRIFNFRKYKKLQEFRSYRSSDNSFDYT